jgi:homoserine dehydrogenase
VRKGSVVAGVNGVTNAVAIDADTMELTLIGPGAGGAATASSVVSDLTDLAAERRMPTFGRPAAGMSKPLRAPMQRHEGGYYIRLSAVDRPGTVAAIATRLAEQNISLESIVQRHRGTHGGEDPNTSAGPVPVILITYATTEAAVRKALSAVEADGAIAEPPQLIRIEKHR